jgi:hypothetical protein
VGESEQIDFYDRPEQVDRSVAFIDDWFKMRLERNRRPYWGVSGAY